MSEVNGHKKNGLPKGWEWIELSKLCEKVSKIKLAEQDQEREFFYLDIGSIDNTNNKIIGHKTYKWKEAPSRAQQIVQKDDILFSTVRTYLKNIALIESSLYDKQIASSGFTVLRGKKNVLYPKFLFYRTIANEFLEPLNKLQTGSSYPAVRDKDVLSQSIPVPSFVVQQQIVSKIEELFSELDRSIEQLKTAQQQLKVYRQSVLKSGFYGELTKEWRNNQSGLSSGEDLVNEIKKFRRDAHNKKLNEYKQQQLPKPKKPFNIDAENDYLNGLLSEKELPNSWKVVPLVFISGNDPDAIVDGPFGSSIDVKKDYVGNGVPVVRMVNVRPFQFVKDDLKFIKEEKFENLRRHNVLSGDVLIAKVGATIGDCCIYPNNEPEGMLSTTGSCRIRVDQSIIVNKFVEYYIFFQKNNLKKIASQTAQPFLNMKMVKSFPIVLPSLKEQSQIISEVESRLSVADKLEETITNSLQQAEALRQSILKKAFEGKLSH